MSINNEVYFLKPSFYGYISVSIKQFATIINCQIFCSHKNEPKKKNKRLRQEEINRGAPQPYGTIHTIGLSLFISGFKFVENGSIFNYFTTFWVFMKY